MPRAARSALPRATHLRDVGLGVGCACDRVWDERGGEHATPREIEIPTPGTPPTSITKPWMLARPALVALGELRNSALLALPRTSTAIAAVLPPTWRWYDVTIAIYLTATGLTMFGQQLAVPEKAPWSKFAIGYAFKTPCSARVGMLTKYLPAFVLSTWWAATRGLGLPSALMMLHFGKRIAEVVLLHNFSGSPTEEFAMSATISLFYAMVAWLHLRADVASSTAAVAVGVATYAAGQAGNLYHHVLLRRLRTGTQDAKKYHVPRGGLFELVGCPHYLCEAVAWAGAAAVAPCAHTWLVAGWVTSMLAGRSVATTRWYRARFGDEYPLARRHLIPWVF